MAVIRRLVLDVLTPHKPNIVDFARTVANQGDFEVRVTVLEMDDKTETLRVVIEGVDVDFDAIEAAISDFGASLHSIDEVEVGTEATSDKSGLEQI